MDPILLGMIKKASSPSDSQVTNAINAYLAKNPVEAYDDTEIKENVNALKSDLGNKESVIIDFIQKGYSEIPFVWEKGAINGVGGADDNSATDKIRTVGMYKIPSGFKYSRSDSVSTWCYQYSSTGVYEGDHAEEKSGFADAESLSDRWCDLCDRTGDLKLLSVAWHGERYRRKLVLSTVDPAQRSADGL